MYEKERRCPGSFRDNAGQVYWSENGVVRTIHEAFSATWQDVADSGFFDFAIDSNLLVPFTETTPILGAWKTLESPRIPFITYPYEWSFAQLKAAALHTLNVLDTALSYGLILRDATAYNVQFLGTQPIFIDLLSFEPWQKDRPWKAYGQFCRHFLTPLALMALRGPDCGKMLSCWLDGIPLSLASSLLPWRTRFSPSLALHIHAHAKLEKKYADARTASAKLKQTRFSEKTIPNLSKSLRFAIEGLQLPSSLHTQWGEYYTDTNYSEAAAADKKHWLERILTETAGDKELAIDVGANTAVYSQHLAKSYKQVLAIDVDYLAVEKLQNELSQKKISNILPLVIDLCNPPPATGWNNTERLSFLDRCQADYVSALALIHHLRFTGGIPLGEIASCFARMLKPGGLHVLEFVPMDDSQVQRMLAARTEENFSDYSLNACLASFEKHFEIIAQHDVAESSRVLLLLKKR